MKILKIVTAVIFPVFMFSACSESEAPKEIEENDNEISGLEDISFDDVDMSAGLADNLMLCMSVHNEVNPIELPHEEKINFDNYDPYYPLTGEEILAFSLDTLGIDSSTFVNLDYWVDLSPDFSTYVFNVELTEHEMATYMVTYFGDYTFIDSKMIGYDEIAESAHRIESKIEKDKITIDDISTWDERVVVTSVFVIDENGNFQEK
jgi:hypothetical protein